MGYEQFEKRILVLVTGLSPQIVTETIYALAVLRKPAFIPTEVHIITTKEGAKRARTSLLTPEQGRFHQLCADYDLTGKIKFDENTIHEINDSGNETMDDIRTPEDNTIAADYITDFMRQMTQDKNSVVHVSIAGGRKTMGFYLGYALSLFGRPQDRLSHVLVSKDFESHPDFYYPPRMTRMLSTRDDKLISTDDAEITLADIPFVTIREKIPEKMQKGRVSYNDIVKAAQNAMAAPRLVIDMDNLTVKCGGVQVDLGLADMAFYIWMAKERKEKGDRALQHYSEMDAKEFLAVYSRMKKGSEMHGDYEKVETVLEGGVNAKFFSPKKSSTNNMIEEKLLNFSGNYIVHKLTEDGGNVFGLLLEPEQIHFIGE